MDSEIEFECIFKLFKAVFKTFLESIYFGQSNKKWDIVSSMLPGQNKQKGESTNLILYK